MKWSNLLLGFGLLVGMGVPRGALAQSSTADTNLVASGATVPSVGGDIAGGPNLLDLEYATARIALKPGDSLATVTFAPWMKPPYRWAYSEARLGFSVEQDGTVGAGAAWGVNGPRIHLDKNNECKKNAALNGSAPLSEHARAELQALEIRQKAELDVACDMISKCQGSPDECNDLKRATEEDCKPETQRGVQARATGIEYALEQLWTRSQATNSAYHMALRTMAMRLEAVNKEWEQKSNAAEKSADDEQLKKRNQCRLEEAYAAGFGFNFLGSARFFTLVEAPSIAPKGGENNEDTRRDGNAQFLRSIDVVGAARAYADRNVMFQVRGGHRWGRANAVQDTELQGQVLLGLDIGVFARGGETDEKGFTPGVGIGFSTTYFHCRADGGCKTNISTNDEEFPKGIPLDWRFQNTLFAEMRLKQELQLRIGFDFYADKVNGQLERAAPGTNDTVIIRLVPKLAAGTSFWGI